MRVPLDSIPPPSRQEGLLVQELPGEVVIYDLMRHRACRLNEVAALIWKSCNGRTSIRQMAQSLEGKLPGPVGAEVIWFGLKRLERAHLLQERLSPSLAERGLSRRELLRRVGKVSLAALPVVAMLVVPSSVQAAASCAVRTNMPCHGCRIEASCGAHGTRTCALMQTCGSCHVPPCCC